MFIGQIRQKFVRLWTPVPQESDMGPYVYLFLLMKLHAQEEQSKHNHQGGGAGSAGSRDQTSQVMK